MTESIVKVRFDTEGEAFAFWTGVSYINDSAIELRRIEHDESINAWVVVMCDDDQASNTIQVLDYRKER